VARAKRTCERLSLFKGKEAKLNYAVFHVLTVKGPQTIYGIHESVKAEKSFRDVSYATVNKRVRSLEKSGCIRKVVKKAATETKWPVYELTEKAQLAMLLDGIGLEGLFTKLDDGSVAAILTVLRKAQISADFRK
jgi:DNA-binding MarR family transcriptional regulator